MGRIRILVVDGSAVARRLLTQVLSSDPQLEVVGTAANGRIALAKVPQLNPDLITLDLHMPDADALQTLAELRKSYPRLPVIAFTPRVDQAAAAAVDTETPGVSDRVDHAVTVNHADAAARLIREELIPRIKGHRGAFTDAGPLCSIAPAAQPRDGRPARGRMPRLRTDVLVIGGSTGGPNALDLLLREFPSDLPVPVLIVQHMPATFTGLLADRLGKTCRIGVSQGTSNELVAPGHAWIAPGDFHMVVQRHHGEVRIQTHQGMPENSCRPSADVLFRSAAEAYGPHVLAVVLTGMGRDGLRGCEQIREAGGQVFVQDQESSIVWGMPGTVANAGLADQVLPLPRLGSEIVRCVREHRPSGPATMASAHSRARMSSNV
jgi:two-component system chemotaxis response regulator CheB